MSITATEGSTLQDASPKTETFRVNMSTRSFSVKCSWEDSREFLRALQAEKVAVRAGSFDTVRDLFKVNLLPPNKQREIDKINEVIGNSDKTKYEFSSSAQ